MTFGVCTIPDRSGLDALPVAKVLDYPLEPRDYRPFAQNILCRLGTGLCLRMWAFEVSPLVGSELLAVLSPFPADPDLALHARVWQGEGGVACHGLSLFRENRLLKAVESYTFRIHSGEDLQGVYWGGELFVEAGLLEELAGTSLAGTGQSFPGNFYKLCDNPRRLHRGSFSPADWDNPWGPASMGTFTILDY